MLPVVRFHLEHAPELGFGVDLEQRKLEPVLEPDHQDGVDAPQATIAKIAGVVLSLAMSSARKRHREQGQRLSGTPGVWQMAEPTGTLMHAPQSTA